MAVSKQNGGVKTKWRRLSPEPHLPCRRHIPCDAHVDGEPGVGGSATEKNIEKSTKFPGQ